MTGRGGAGIQPPDPRHKVILPSPGREVDWSAVGDHSGPAAIDGVSWGVRSYEEAQPPRAEVEPGGSLQAHPPPWNLLGKEGNQLGGRPHLQEQDEPAPASTCQAK